MYLVCLGKKPVLATTLEVACAFFEGIHERPMRASALPGGYVYEVYPDFPGREWGPRERAIANLGLQKPEEVPVPPIFPYVFSDEWGKDDNGPKPRAVPVVVSSAWGRESDDDDE
jgi:hypothetical protein